MFYVVIAVILLAVLLIAVGYSLVTREFGGFAVAGVVFLILAIFTGFCSATTVGARAVGIQTGFGRYMDTLEPGFQWTAPWSKVEQFPTLVQTLDLDNSDGSKDGNVSVAYQGGGDGQVNATIRWRIDTKDAEELWRNYQTFDNVSERLVKNSARDSIKSVVGKYTPSEARDGNNLRNISEAVKADLSQVLAQDGIAIDSVSIVRIDLGEQAQRAVDRIVEANANTERAKSENERARIDAETNKIREAEGVLTPQALQRYCLELTNSWDVAKNGNLPATWSCFGDKANASVLVNGGK